MTILLSLFLLQVSKVQISVGDQQKILDTKTLEASEYVNLTDLCNLLELQFVFDHSKQAVVMVGPESEVVLYLNIFIAKIDSIYRTIPFSPLMVDGEILFPKALITQFFTKHFNKLVLARDIETRPEIKGYNLQNRGDTVVFQFETEYETEADIDLVSKKAILEINGLLPAQKVPKKFSGIKFVKSYDVTPFANYTRFSFILADKNVETMLRDNELLFMPPALKVIDIICLDAGHGGIDPGAIGKKGLYEKDCNLDITLKLRRLVEDSLKLKVVLTRDDDYYLSLGKRTKLANRSRADLFVSIHCNASKRKKKSAGMETYFLSEAKTDEARATAALENAAVKFDEPQGFSNELEFIFFDLAQSEFLRESSNLAELIQEEAGVRLTIPDRGINQANFYVLNGAFMPAVLVESAFISNVEEERLLKDSKFRTSIAYCVFCGIRKFVKDYETRRHN